MQSSVGFWLSVVIMAAPPILYLVAVAQRVADDYLWLGFGNP
jgi:hypothetical protein